MANCDLNQVGVTLKLAAALFPGELPVHAVSFGFGSRDQGSGVL
jgi:hypothetical protein